jgi:hypothetical protein
MNRELTVGVEPRSLRRALVFDELRVPTPGERIELDSSAEFDCISVTTRRSVYEIILRSARTGDAFVRGGTFFPTFRRATIAGSNFGGTALMVRTICVGLRLELVADGERYVTSPIRTISRRPLRECMQRRPRIA